jgi:hypothetical protein
MKSTRASHYNYELASPRLLEMQARMELKKLELNRLIAKLNNLRTDRKERVRELEKENQHVVSEKLLVEQHLLNETEQKHQLAEHELKQTKLSFDVEMSKLVDETDELRRQYEKQKENNRIVEASLLDKTLKLSIEIHKLCTDHSTTVGSLVSKIEALKDMLQHDTKRRVELHDHYARVDRNNTQKELEETKLHLVAVQEEKAINLLHHGARGLQKLWRGRVARENFAKLEKKKKQKKGKKNGKAKKKKE